VRPGFGGIEALRETKSSVTWAAGVCFRMDFSKDKERHLLKGSRELQISF
jgi:hypothetical protein